MAGVLSTDAVWLWPLVILCGAMIYLPRPKSDAGRGGHALIGIGLILLALQLMADSAASMVQVASLWNLLSVLTRDPLLDVLVGAGLTVLVRSDLVSVLLALALASSHPIALKVGICFVVPCRV